MRRLGLFTLLVTLLVALSLAWAGNRPIHAQADPASEMLRLVNEVRARNGLPPFTWNAQLAAAAQTQSNYMAEFNVYVHSGYGGSTPYSRALAAGYTGSVSENVVGGTNLSPRGGVLWWENSPVHLRNMLASHHVEAGIGVAYGYDQTFYTLVIGHRTANPPARANVIADDQPAPLRVTPITLASPREDGSIVHVLQPGQAMWTIAAHYDVDLDFLLQINNMDEDDFVIDGQDVLVRPPDDWVPPPTPTPPSTHIVQEGENLWYITYLYELEMSDLLWLNGLSTDGDIIRPGDTLKVRLLPGEAPPPTPTPQQTHFVQTGDTLWSIALSYGLTLDELLGYNNLAADALLQIGDELWIRPKPQPTPTNSPPPTATPQPIANAPAPASAPPTSIPTVPPSPQPTSAPMATQTPADSPPAADNPGGSTGLLVAAGVLSLLAGAAVVATIRTR